jgi:hypothetical protein
MAQSIQEQANKLKSDIISRSGISYIPTQDSGGGYATVITKGDAQRIVADPVLGPTAKFYDRNGNRVEIGSNNVNATMGSIMSSFFGQQPQEEYVYWIDGNNYYYY